MPHAESFYKLREEVLSKKYLFKFINILIIVQGNFFPQFVQC